MSINRNAQSTYELYESQLTKESSRFMRCVLRAALIKLKGGISEKKVESWVVKLEKLYRKKL